MRSESKTGEKSGVRKASIAEITNQPKEASRLPLTRALWVLEKGHCDWGFFLCSSTYPSSLWDLGDCSRTPGPSICVECEAMDSRAVPARQRRGPWRHVYKAHVGSAAQGLGPAPPTPGSVSCVHSIQLPQWEIHTPDLGNKASASNCDKCLGNI